jgi:integrase
MSSVAAFIRISTKKVERANVRFRLRDGRGVQLFYKSEIEVNPSLWDSDKQTIKAKVIFNAVERAAFNNAIADRKNIILKAYNSEPNKPSLTSESLATKIDEFLNPDKYLPAGGTLQTFFETFTEFLEKHKLSDVRKNNYQVVLRALQRYELYITRTTSKPFKLNLDTITAVTLHNIEDFLRKEFTICKEMPEIYEAVPESRTPQPRGQNTINGIFTKMRTFYLWSIDAGKTINNPFRGFTVDECVYGTPYYISIDERNKLYKTDLSQRPQLAIQRDIFVFQCLIGCRVNDLYKMTTANIISGAVEYIPRKTRDGRPLTVRVPLNTTAKEILSRYPANKGGRLLPYISEQKYNIAIKESFKLAELTRMVTVVNPTTREEDKRPLNEIASSHLARRCFIGNLYKQVKDPNLVGALSGHKEGSKAFARYREIDEEMKIDLVNLLD